MNKIFVSPLFAIAFAVAAPAAAQDDISYVTGTGDDYAGDTYDKLADSQGGMMRVADRMSDPAMQDNIAHVVEGTTAAIMDLPVGRFAEVIENAIPGSVGRHVNRDTTLGDMAGQDSRYAPEELGNRSRDIVGQLGNYTRVMAAMLPEFERLARDMAADIAKAKPARR